MTVEPIYYVKAFLLKNPGIREHFRTLLTSSGFTDPSDLRAWKIVEEQFLLPYRERIYPKRVCEKYARSSLPIPVDIGSVIAMIMERI